jgi:hypothetical protein
MSILWENEFIWVWPNRRRWRQVYVSSAGSLFSRFLIFAIKHFVGLLDEAMLLMAELEFLKRWIPGVGD